MHIHPNQINSNMQLDSLYAAEKAAAKREIERTRKKLLEYAAKLSGEDADSGEDCVVKLGAHDQEQKDQSQEQSRRKKSTGDLSSENEDKSISDWA
jgi:hypothetical protein